jgi:hypothetical protein
MVRAKKWVVSVAVLALAAASVTTGQASAAATAGQTISDFNGDGVNDLAIGSPRGIVNGQEVGSVTVLFGSRQGLSPQSRIVLHQDSPGVPGDAKAGYSFGGALATEDFNGDGFDDLAVGAANDGVTGSVTVFFGSGTGLGQAARVTGTRHLGAALTAGDMDGDGLPEIIATETPDTFGQIKRFIVSRGAFTPVQAADTSSYGYSMLASGDVDNDGYDDLVALYNQVGGSYSFSYFPGSPAGLATEGRTDHMYDGGVDLAIGDLDQDGYADLVVGRSQEKLGMLLGGEVTIWNGSATGLAEEPRVILDQDTPDVPDVAEQYDQFGSSVAIGDITGDGHPELAIGAQQEDVGEVTDAGAVTVLRGSADGVTTTGGQWLTQGSTGVPGAAQAHDQFGWMLLVRDFDGDGNADLTMTAIGENPPADWPYYGEGSVTVVPGDSTGATGPGATVWTPDSVGQGPAKSRFGWALGR